MNARRVAKELEYHTKGLNRNLPAVPPTLTKEETKQVELWKRFITYEKSNPLRTEDTALVTRRVMFATEQCLLVLTHHPAVWHQASQFLDTSARALTEKGVRSRIQRKPNKTKTQIEKKFYQNSCLVVVVVATFVKCRPLGNVAHDSYMQHVATICCVAFGIGRTHFTRPAIPFNHRSKQKLDYTFSYSNCLLI